MANKKISELTAATSLTVDELMEIVQGGVNKRAPLSLLQSTFGITREFDRSWSSELLFDKNEIEYAEHTLTEDLEFTVAGAGHLTNQFSSAVQRVVTDGTHSVSFTGFNFVIGDIQSGSVPDAGTYLVLFLYWNGVATVNWTIPSLEVANLTPLATPSSFAAVPDGDNEIDLSWGAVMGAVSYELYYSTAGGGGPWTEITGIGTSTSYSHTGRVAGTTYHYRIRAIGDLVSNSNSQYVVIAATTTSSGDTTPPVFTFDPEDAETDIPVNAIVTISADEAIRNADGTEVTNANLDDVVIARVDNSSGSDIAFSGAIDAGKMNIALTPTLIWGANQDVYVEIDGVEDVNGNELASPASATFTTGTYTLMRSNSLELGSSLDSFIVGANKKFEIEVTFKDAPFTSASTGIARKWSSSGNQRSFIFRMDSGNVYFKWYQDGTDVHHTREIIWTGVMPDSNEHTLRLVYDGTVNTNNGLDRAELYIDGVLQGSKSLVAFDDIWTGSVWPFGIFSGSAPTAFLKFSAQMKDLVFRADTGSGMVDEMDIPVIRTGVDVSGNGRHGTWV